MKLFKILLIAIIAFQPVSSIAQVDRAQQATNLKYFNEIFGKNDKDFEILKSPEQWKDDPVVILCQKTHMSFLRNPGERGSRTKGVIRKRILIQDKSALEEFSEFYYQEGLAVGIRHIKSDGSERDIDTKEAVKVETDVPKFYADSYSSDDYFKIAIPDLEVGDILDYFKVFSERYSSNVSLINTIASTYPIVNQEIIFDVDKWSFFYGTFNGAPKFVQDKTGGVNHKGKKKTAVDRFVLKDENRAAYEDERWSYTYLSEPSFKIMAIPPNGTIGNKKIKNISKEKLSVKASMKPILANAAGMINGTTFPALIKNSLRTAGIKSKTQKQKVELIYNTVRYQFIKGLAFGDSGEDGLTYTDRYNQMRSDIFTVSFWGQLKKNKIDAQVVAIVPRYYGKIDDVVMENELVYGVYVPVTDKYYWPVDNYRTSGDPYTKAFSANGYKVDYQKLMKSSSPDFKKITTPPSKAKDNLHSTTMEISVNDDLSLSITGNKKYTGTYKDYYSTLLLLQTDYFNDDILRFGSSIEKSNLKKKHSKAPKKKPRSRRGKARQKYLEELKQKQLEVSERKKEIIENWLKDDYELEELQDFTVTAFGRTAPDDTALEADMAFTSKGYLKKAGPNLIFEVGKLITSQVELTEEEINERKNPVDQNYARTIDNSITIILPEGYQAKGLEGMNINIDNPSAAFISTVTQEGNTLIINTSKVYKKEHIEKADWESLVKMLEGAYDFSQKKIILKK